MKRKINLFLLISGLCLLGCGKNKPGDIAGTSSQAGNALTGVALDISGSPVSGASVWVYPTTEREDSAPYPGKLEIIDSANTDDNGCFRFIGLKAGKYTLDCRSFKDGLFGMVKGVVFDSTRSVIDTLVLKKPGSICGTVYMGMDNALFPFNGYVLVNIEGLYDHLVMADRYGKYVINGVSEGVYTIGYYANNSYYLNEYIDSVRVSPDSVSILMPVYLKESPDAPPSKPVGFTARYDTANALVYLQWRPVLNEKLLGYQVVRKILFNEGSDFSSVITDTVYVDTVSGVAAGTKIMYMVRSIDKAYNESLNAGPIELVIKK